MPILPKAQLRDLRSQLEAKGEVLSRELVLLQKLQVLLDSMNYDSMYFGFISVHWMLFEVLHSSNCSGLNFSSHLKGLTEQKSIWLGGFYAIDGGLVGFPLSWVAQRGAILLTTSYYMRHVFFCRWWMNPEVLPHGTVV